MAKVEDFESVKYDTSKFILLILAKSKQIRLFRVRLGNANETLLNFLFPRPALLFNADKSAYQAKFRLEIGP